MALTTGTTWAKRFPPDIILTYRPLVQVVCRSCLRPSIVTQSPVSKCTLFLHHSRGADRAIVRKRNVQANTNATPTAKRLKVDDYEDTDENFHPSRRASATSTLVRQSSAQAKDLEERMAFRSLRDDATPNDTRTTLANCANKLRAAMRSIKTDRENLYERWEVDPGLKLQTVTESLLDLNNRFFKAEELLQDAITAGEDGLLSSIRE